MRGPTVSWASDRLEIVSSLESHLRYDLELTEKISYTC